MSVNRYKFGVDNEKLWAYVAQMMKIMEPTIAEARRLKELDDTDPNRGRIDALTDVAEALAGMVRYDAIFPPKTETLTSEVEVFKNVKEHCKEMHSCYDCKYFSNDKCVFFDLPGEWKLEPLYGRERDENR